MPSFRECRRMVFSVDQCGEKLPEPMNLPPERGPASYISLAGETQLPTLSTSW
jgi:hypothetical protein